MATLLIVEDDRKTNDAICEYLKPTGHKVIPAYDGVEALQLFRENSIDLVVLDIMLLLLKNNLEKRCRKW